MGLHVIYPIEPELDQDCKLEYVIETPNAIDFETLR